MTAPANLWDVIVIGAGVAGAAAALAIVRRAPDARILLLERSAWPRPKVCGCCVNAAGVAILESLGVGPAVRRRSIPLARAVVHAGGRCATFDHSGGVAIDRQDLDAVLVDHAESGGVVFRPRCAGRIVGREAELWQVRIARGAGPMSARMVLIADGLAGGALDELPEFRPVVRRSSWMGLGGAIPAASWPDSPAPGTIRMHVGSHGYVGLVRLPDERLALGSAIDPQRVRRMGGPAAAIREILGPTEDGAELPDLASLRGTPLLTRRRGLVASGSLLVLGDAAGYVEPFTGEGMGWALAGARRASEVVAAVLAGKLTSEQAGAEWSRWHRTRITPRQRICTRVRTLLRVPGLPCIAVACAAAVPALGRALGSIATGISQPHDARSAA